jgi:hypothetical protein
MKRRYPSRNGKPAFLHVFASALVLLMPLAGWFWAAGCGSGSDSGSDGGKTWTVKLSGEADFRSLQQCIDEAVSGDTCLVYPGTYPGTVQYKGKTIDVQSVAGPEQTILDGDYLDQDGQGDDTVVRFMDNEGAGAILDGFTVTNGAAADHGGGIYIEAASPTIRNCIIRDNTAAGDGGGIYCFGSTARPLIRNTVIEANTVQGQGGALCVLYGSPDLINCLLFGNEAMRGGAVSARQGAAVTLENCTVADNQADEDGGGLYLLHSTATVSNSILWANDAPAGSQASLALQEATEATRLLLRYVDLQGGRAGVVGGANDCSASPTPNPCLGIEGTFLQADPLFVPFDDEPAPAERDPALGYYLSQSATQRADQPTDGPCVDAGDPLQIIGELGIEERTTRTDEELDAAAIDIGYHYAVVE